MTEQAGQVANADVDALAYDDAFAELQGVVARLEAGGESLEATIALAVMVAGLVYALRTYEFIHEALVRPERFEHAFASWARAVGGDDLAIEINGKAVKAARPLAVVVVGGGSLCLLWISLLLIKTGARVFYWILLDRKSPESKLK